MDEAAVPGSAEALLGPQWERPGSGPPDLPRGRRPRVPAVGRDGVKNFIEWRRMYPGRDLVPDPSHAGPPERQPVQHEIRLELGAQRVASAVLGSPDCSGVCSDWCDTVTK